MEKRNDEFIGSPNVRTLGYEVDREKILNPLWNSFSTMQSYDSISNQMLLMEKYELALGIQRLPESLPISLVTIKPEINSYYNSSLEKTIKQLIKIKACEATGYNINELLDLPTYELKIIIKALTELKQEEGSSATTRDLDKLTKQLK